MNSENAKNTNNATTGGTPLGSAFKNAFEGYYSVNDRGHRAEHFSAVEALGHEINREMELGIDPDLITISAWTHDMFAWSRKNHHLLSALWVRTTDHPLIVKLSDEQREQVAVANECHRASYEGDFPTNFAALMSSADRGRPGDLHNEIMRSWDYSEYYLGLNIHDGLLRAVKHQQEKYGRNGHARIPDLYKTYFGAQLEDKYQRIEKLQGMSFDEITTYLSSWYCH